MYEKKEKNPLAGEPSFRRIRFPDEKYEAEGLKILHRLGVPFELGKGDREYIVTSGQCFVLRENYVKYRKYKKLYPHIKN